MCVVGHGICGIGTVRVSVPTAGKSERLNSGVTLGCTEGITLKVQFVMMSLICIQGTHAGNAKSLSLGQF